MPCRWPCRKQCSGLGAAVCDTTPPLRQADVRHDATPSAYGHWPRPDEVAFSTTETTAGGVQHHQTMWRTAKKSSLCTGSVQCAAPALRAARVACGPRATGHGPRPQPQATPHTAGRGPRPTTRNPHITTTKTASLPPVASRSRRSPPRPLRASAFVFRRWLAPPAPRCSLPSLGRTGPRFVFRS
jgi:hypothetical protein